MITTNPISLLYAPRSAWQQIARRAPDSVGGALLSPLLLALLPAAAWYFGTTRVGWRIGGDEAVRLSSDSALAIAILFYLAMVGAVAGIGYMIHWMSQTYGANSTLAKGVAIAGFTATPLFVAGAIGFYPLMWLALALGLAAVSYAVYLLYTGIPIVMGIPEERGFLFASAIVAVSLVVVISIMGATVILWDLGATPTFVD
jgi:hypothetical protein